MMGEEKDTTLLKKIFHFYGCFGMFSYNKKYIIIFTASFHLLAAIFFTITASTNTDVRLSVVGTFIFGAFYFMMIIFDLVCLKNAYYQKSLWKQLFKDIELFDSIIEGTVFMESIYKYYTKFGVSTILCTTAYSLTILSLIRTLRYHQTITLAYFYFLINYMFVTTILFQKLIRIAQKRYDFLRRKVKKDYSPTNAFKWPCNRQQLESSHLLMDNIVKAINNIFGRKICLIIVITFLGILGNFQYTLLEDSQTKYRDLNNLVTSLISIVFLMVSI